MQEDAQPEDIEFYKGEFKPEEALTIKSTSRNYNDEFSAIAAVSPDVRDDANIDIPTGGQICLTSTNFVASGVNISRDCQYFLILESSFFFF